MSKLCENTVGALKQGHVVLQACYCQSRIWVQLSKEPWVRYSGKVPAGMTFSLKVLFICSIIIPAYTFYNNSSILNLGTSLEFTNAFMHYLTQFVCFWHKEELKLKKENGINQNHTESKPGFELRFSSSKPASLPHSQELPRKFKHRYIWLWLLYMKMAATGHTSTLAALAMV